MSLHPLRWLQQRIGQHPDRVALLIIILVAIGMRLALVYRSPVFIRQDSIAYFQSGYELARGIRVDIPLRRTPGYPLFLAGAVWTIGEDLNSIALLQHLVGIGTAVITYLLGRAIFGRVAGLIAGLLAAISGPLLLYEHYLMSEALFTFFLTLGMWLGVRGLKHSSWKSICGAGIAVGLAYQFRPVGAVLVPVLMLGALLWAGSPRVRIGRSALPAIGFLMILGPVFVLSRLVSAESAPALGQTLYGRLVRHDEKIEFPNPDSRAPFSEPDRVAARRMILQLAARDARPSAVNHRLQEALGLTPNQADRALRDFAIETVSTQQSRFIQGSINKTRLILEGESEKLSFHWNSRIDRDLRDDWTSNTSIAHVLIPITETQRRERDNTDALLKVFQPAQYDAPLFGLVFLGILGAAIRSAWRPALLIPLATLALVIPAGILVGQVPRYRYPADPMLAVLVGGGVTLVLWLIPGISKLLRSRSIAAQANAPLSGAPSSSVPG